MPDDQVPKCPKAPAEAASEGVRAGHAFAHRGETPQRFAAARQLRVELTNVLLRWCFVPM